MDGNTEAVWSPTSQGLRGAEGAKGKMTEEGWAALNRTRGRLIDAEIAGTLTGDERVRLDQLNALADQRLEDVAPRQYPRMTRAELLASGVPVEHVDGLLEGLGDAAVGRVMPMSEPKTIEQLVAEQHVHSIEDVSILSGAIPDEDVDEFVAEIYRARRGTE